MDSCIFCKIITGSVPAATVWESETILSFVDVRQAHPGHILVIPKAHVTNLFELPDDLAEPLMLATKRLASAVNAAYQPDGVSLWQSNGPGAHQEVPHLHIHIHPRWSDDSVLKVYADKPDKPSLDILEERAKLIRSQLESIS